MAQPDNRDGQSVTLCPIQLSESVLGRQFDAVLNTGSLGEMTSDWAEYWMTWLDRQTADTFYSLNLIGNPIDQIFEARNAFAVPVTDQWSATNVDTSNPIVRSQSDDRHQAEIVFSRAPEQSLTSGQVTAAWHAIKHERLSRENYARFCYLLARHPSPDLVLEFAQKAIADLESTPVELLHLAEKAIAKNQATTPAHSALTKMATDWRETFDQHFPTGAYTS